MNPLTLEQLQEMNRRFLARKSERYCFKLFREAPLRLVKEWRGGSCGAIIDFYAVEYTDLKYHFLGIDDRGNLWQTMIPWLSLDHTGKAIENAHKALVLPKWLYKHARKAALKKARLEVQP